MWAMGSNGRVNVGTAFEASGEFQTLVANLYGNAASDNERTEHFVNNFYLGAYGRSATSTELQQQRDALNAAAAQSQAAVQTQAETFGRSLFTAQVNDASLSNAQYVTNLYEAFLQRGPDAGGLGWWSAQATVGQGRQNVLNAFAVCSAFRELSGTLYREANWLVADQLGTPRMIFDQSGSLANVKRHDYAPFGEELTSVTGLRSSVAGYAVADNVRQKFTQKERDNETGLDYFGARYYSSTQGRFTSADPGMIKLKHLLNPQKWNRYAYTLNNPLRFFDPDGMEEIEVIIRTFIPSKEIHVPTHAKGDGRKAGESGTSRTEIRVKIETDPARNNGNPLVGKPVYKAGESTEYRPVIGGDGRYTGESREVKGQASGDSLHADVSRQYQPGGGVPMVQIDVSGNEKFPLTPQSVTPGIKFDFSIGIQPSQYDSSGREINATISGGVAVFPETEISVIRQGSQTEQLIYDHPPSGITRTPLDLATQQPDQVTKQVKIKP
jgi:RHS repeat-associated protein